MPELHWLSATELAAYPARELTSLKAVDARLQRIAAVDPHSTPWCNWRHNSGDGHARLISLARGMI